MYPFTHKLHCDTPDLLTFEDFVRCALVSNLRVIWLISAVHSLLFIRRSQASGIISVILSIREHSPFTTGALNPRSEPPVPGYSVYKTFSHMARVWSAITERRALIDYCEYASSIGKEYDAIGHHTIGSDDMMACIVYQEQLPGISMK